MENKDCLNTSSMQENCFVVNMLNDKTIILLNLAEYPLILANSAYGLVGLVSADMMRDFAGKLLVVGRMMR